MVDGTPDGYIVRPSFPPGVELANLDPFGQIKVVQKTPIIELSANFPFSTIVEIGQVAGSGSQSQMGGERLISTGATASSSYFLRSAKRGRYKPGYEAEAGIGNRVANLPTGNQYGEFGYFDVDNGFYFGIDAQGIYVALMDAGVVKLKTYQSEWNVNKLPKFNISRGNIFQIDFTYYGYGLVLFRIVQDRGDLTQRIFTVHVMNVFGSTTISDPNLPVSARVGNGATASNFGMYIGGRQFAIVGKYIPSERITSAELTKTGIGTSYVPIISFRKKAGRFGIPVRIESLDAVVSAKCRARFIANSTLGTPTWGNVSAVIDQNETALQEDVASTSYTVGNNLRSALIPAAGTGSNTTGSASVSGLDVEFVEDQAITLVMRALSGTVDVDLTVRMLEDW